MDREPRPAGIRSQRNRAGHLSQIGPRTTSTESEQAVATATSIVGAYLLTNWFPFDSFSITWDRRQVGLLILNFLALALPFFFSGMAVGLLLSTYPRNAGQVYAVNLTGSALGCLAALAAPGWVGGEGTVTLSCALAALACLVCSVSPGAGRSPSPCTWRTRGFIVFLALALVLISALDLGLSASGRPTLALLDLRLSPYKGLSYALQYP